MTTTLDLNGDIKSATKSSEAHLTDHKKYTTGNKLGQLHILSFHQPNQRPKRVAMLTGLDPVDDIEKGSSGKSADITAGLMKSKMIQDGTWEKRAEPELSQVHDFAIAPHMDGAFREKEFDRAYEHIFVCEGHTVTRIKVLTFERMDNILENKCYAGMSILDNLNK